MIRTRAGPTQSKLPPRNWWRFTIRGALIATAIIAMFLGYRTNIGRREAPALQLVREHGCTPRYRHDIFGNFPSFAPQFVREAVGVENFGSAVRLNFADGTPTSDEAFVMLDRLPSVTVVNTDGALISDAGLAPIAHLSHLSILRLTDAKNITDRGVEHLRELKELVMLDLDGTQVTDRGLADISELNMLESLSLMNTQVTDAGIMQLTKLKRLHYLQVQRTSVTKNGVDEFKKRLPNCQVNYSTEFTW